MTGPDVERSHTTELRGRVQEGLRRFRRVMNGLEVSGTLGGAGASGLGV